VNKVSIETPGESSYLSANTATIFWLTQCIYTPRPTPRLNYTPLLDSRKSNWIARYGLAETVSSRYSLAKAGKAHVARMFLSRTPCRQGSWRFPSYLLGISGTTLAPDFAGC